MEILTFELSTVEMLSVAFFSFLAAFAFGYTIYLIALGRRAGWDTHLEVSVKLPALIIRTNRMLPVVAAVGQR